MRSPDEMQEQYNSLLDWEIWAVWDIVEISFDTQED